MQAVNFFYTAFALLIGLALGYVVGRRVRSQATARARDRGFGISIAHLNKVLARRGLPPLTPEQEAMLRVLVEELSN